MKRVATSLLLVVLFSLLSFAQEAVNFGTVPVGASVPGTYTFRNTGLTSCTLEAIGFGEALYPGAGPFTLVPPDLPYLLPGGGVVQWTVIFAPVSAGSFAETMFVRVRYGLFRTTYSVQVVGAASGASATSDLALGSAQIPSAGCPCSADLAGLVSNLAALSTVVQGQIAPALRAAQISLAELEAATAAQPQDSLPSYGPFPAQGGQRFADLIAAQKALLEQAAIVLPAIDPEDATLQALLDSGARAAVAVLPELDQLASLVAQLPADQRSLFDTYIPDAAIQYVNATTTVVANPFTHPKLAALLASSGTGVIGKIWDKVRIWIGRIPGVGDVLDGLVQDIDALTESAEDPLQTASYLFLYELELKVDAVIRGLFGIDIPPNATEAELAARLREIPSESIVSRLGRMEDAERALSDDVEEISERTANLEDIARRTEAELTTMERKICCFIVGMNRFAEELGDALYGNRAAFSDFVPTMCRGVTPAECFGYTTEVLAAEPIRKPIKPEIEGLESDMRVVRETLDRILNELERLRSLTVTPTFPVETPPVTPPATTITLPEEASASLALTKKIYVYEEGTFSARDGADTREVVIETAAFDVSGWLDLSELRAGDAVTVAVWVRVDGRERRFSSTQFQGGPDSRLLYFREFVGESELVGTWIKVMLAQPTSADSFSTAIPIGYQFVVESQN